MDTRSRYVAAATPLSAVVDAFDRDDWDKPSACADWTAREVIAHIITTERDMLNERGFPLTPGPDVDADPAEAWRSQRDAVSELLVDPTVAATAYDGFFGPTTIGQTLEQFYIFDLIVHRWDLAMALGRHEALTDAEMDQIDQSLVVFGPHMYSPGLFFDGVVANDPTDRQQVLLARMGRATAE